MLRSVVFVAAIALVAAYPRKPEMAVDAETVEHINANQSSWIATAENKFSRWTLLEAQRLMGVRSLVPSGETPIKTHNVDAASLPESFDCREAFAPFMHPVRDQQQCGSCWAFSGAEVLTDRFAIASNGSINVVLSPEDMVSCDTGDMGCQGGYLDAEWKYLVETGIVSDACFPYSAGSGVAPTCSAKCADSEAWKKYKAADSFHLTSVEDMQAELMKNGPLQVAFEVRKSFLAYKTGVYQHHFWQFWDQVLGGHAVKLMGWGVEKGEKYWIVQNSWSTQWGEEGFFRIKRGTNECGIEAMVYGGHAAL